jgi:hypothetical protein
MRVGREIDPDHDEFGSIRPDLMKPIEPEASKRVAGESTARRTAFPL